MSCTTEVGEEGGEVTIAAATAVVCVAIAAVAIAALVTIAAVVVSQPRATAEVVTALGHRGALGRRGQKRGVPAPPNCASLLSSPSPRHCFCIRGCPRVVVVGRSRAAVAVVPASGRHEWI
jgi:hypothetical protein